MHAGGDGLVEYINGFGRRRLERIFSVHVEPERAEPLRTHLEKIDFRIVTILARGEMAEV